jgi:hypothetical protein
LGLGEIAVMARLETLSMTTRREAIAVMTWLDAITVSMRRRSFTMLVLWPVLLATLAPRWEIPPRWEAALAPIRAFSTTSTALAGKVSAVARRAAITPLTSQLTLIAIVSRCDCRLWSRARGPVRADVQRLEQVQIEWCFLGICRGRHRGCQWLQKGTSEKKSSTEARNNMCKYRPNAPTSLRARLAKTRDI